MRRLCLFLAAWAALAAPSVACSSVQPIETWACFELSFTADSTYDYPARDGSLRVRFQNAAGDSVSVDGFWDGGLSWRARAAFPAAGLWTWTATSSDAGLDAHTGTVTVTPAEGTDPFRAHGWPRVGPTRRALSYDDGTPFFYLADTAWEMAWTATRSQLDIYLADRAAKGFNAIQVVVNSHIFDRAWHVTNQDGQRYLLDDDRSKPNPRYFDFLDQIVRQANASGMAVVLVPIWATYASVHVATTNHPPERLYTQEDALVQARYVGARYAGSNVMWVVGGDQQYDTDEKRQYWDAFARQLRRASGGLHLSPSQRLCGQLRLVAHPARLARFPLLPGRALRRPDLPRRERAAPRGRLGKPPSRRWRLRVDRCAEGIPPGGADSGVERRGELRGPVHAVLGDQRRHDVRGAHNGRPCAAVGVVGPALGRQRRIRVRREWCVAMGIRTKRRVLHQTSRSGRAFVPRLVSAGEDETAR